MTFAKPAKLQGSFRKACANRGTASKATDARSLGLGAHALWYLSVKGGEKREIENREGGEEGEGRGGGGHHRNVASYTTQAVESSADAVRGNTTPALHPVALQAILCEKKEGRKREGRRGERK
jgi:hypothetical protein